MLLFFLRCFYGGADTPDVDAAADIASARYALLPTSPAVCVFPDLSPTVHAMLLDTPSVTPFLPFCQFYLRCCLPRTP